jgi:aspartyl protease family protein
MQKAFLVVTLLGAGIGFAWPTRPEQTRPGAELAPGEIRETVLERSRGGHFYADVEVNGEMVRFVVDTGASAIALSEKDARRVGLRFDRDEYEEVGSGASGPVRGKLVTLDKVSLDGKVATGLSGAILQGSEFSLQNYLGRFSIEIRGDTMRIY